MCIKKYAYCMVCEVFRAIPREPVLEDSIVFTVKEKLCGRSYCNRFNVIFPQYVQLPIPGHQTEGTCGSARCDISTCRIERVYSLCPDHERQRHEENDNDDDCEDEENYSTEYILETTF